MEQPYMLMLTREDGKWVGLSDAPFSSISAGKDMDELLIVLQSGQDAGTEPGSVHFLAPDTGNRHAALVRLYTYYPAYRTNRVHSFGAFYSNHPLNFPSPARILLLRSDEITGPYTRIEAFDKSMETIEEGKYEAATAVKLEDGRWCLFLDYYGVPGAGQGYVPFVADSLASGNFIKR
mgnify:CR=1 FL=1